MTTAFDNEEFALAYPDGVENNYWSIARNGILLSIIRSAGLQRLKWIEVGCGRGVVVRYMRSKGIACDGVELADIAPLSGVEDHVTVNKDARALPQAYRDGFEGMLLLDVIEHIEHPIAFVSGLMDAFPNVRHILITVPARPEIWSNYDEFYGHFRRYNTETMKATVSALGLKLDRMRYFFHGLYPAARILLSAGSKRPIKVIAPVGWRATVHRVIGAGFILEAMVMPSMLPGTSLLCLASRNG